MAGLIPDARLIFMVRDPIDRVRAGYLHRYSNRAESRPMREAVLAPGETYVSRSQYYLQLSQFLEHYPMERILLLDQDELLNDRRPTMERVYGFLGVDEGFWRKTFNEPRLESARRGRRTRLGVRRLEAAPAANLAEGQASPAVLDAVREARDRRLLPRGARGHPP